MNLRRSLIDAVASLVRVDSAITRENKCGRSAGDSADGLSGRCKGYLQTGSGCSRKRQGRAHNLSRNRTESNGLGGGSGHDDRCGCGGRLEVRRACRVRRVASRQRVAAVGKRSGRNADGDAAAGYSRRRRSITAARERYRPGRRDPERSAADGNRHRQRLHRRDARRRGSYRQSGR